MAGNSVGTAYLTLVPKLEGGGLKSLEGQIKKSGSKSGDGFSANFNKAVKKVAGIAVAADIGKKFGEAFSQAFNGAADFEQLKGGVEKIFDEMDNSQIFADAQNAYHDLNMSANDYLATINDVGAAFSASMGDEAGYKTARQGLKAIADYASGTGKNVDTLKEKFTAITRATSSYQSIADQFSGILPATSADFLEQAKAAGFLEDSYKKLTDVPIAEYQQAVAAMLEKGADDLGLLGNTAAETENTVSGSINGMKAAWSDWLSALGTPDADMGAMTEKLLSSIGAAAKNIVPVFGRITQSIVQQMPQIVMALSGTIGQIGTYLQQNSSQIGMAIGDFIASIGGFIVQHGPEILAAAGQLFLGLTEALGIAAAEVVVKLGTAIGEWVSQLPAAVGDMLSGAQQFFDGISSAVGEAVGNVGAKLGELIQSACDKVTGAAGDMMAAGQNFIQGLVDGIGAGADWVISKVQSLCADATSALKSFFGIHSPSKLMFEMGGYISQGLADGIEAKGKNVIGAWDGVTDGIGSKSVMVDMAARASAAGAAAGAQQSGNTYIIQNVDLTGDADVEAAMLTIFNKMQRLGRM